MVVRLYYLKCVNDATRTFDRSIATVYRSGQIKMIRCKKGAKIPSRVPRNREAIVSENRRRRDERKTVRSRATEIMRDSTNREHSARKPSFFN